MPYSNPEDQKKQRTRWRDKNREKNREVTRLSAQKVKARNRGVIEEAKDRPCADCHQSFPPYIMDFDHLRDKRYTISRRGAKFSLEALRAEIAKCDVVCANCHRRRTWERSQRNESIVHD